VKHVPFVLAAFAVGCGGSWLDEPLPRTPQEPPPRAASASSQKPVPPPGSLFRQDVNRTVEEGLGFFLQRVSVDADLDNGKFQGFRIVELRPPEYWQTVDLKPGDVVTQVNGMPIERDIDAYQAFQSLRAAPSLHVTYFRAGVQRELVYSIIDRDGKSGATPPSAAPAPGEPPKPAQKSPAPQQG
jgi:hypothetical protein